MKFCTLQSLRLFILLTSLVVISSCSDTEENKLPENDAEYIDENDDENDDSDYYRPGVITIDVSIKQSVSLSESTSGKDNGLASTSELNWSFDLQAKFVRDAKVELDLSNPFWADEEDEYEDSEDVYKSNAYTGGPYTFGRESWGDAQPPAVVTGNIKYDLTLDYHTPNASDTIRFEKNTLATGTIHEIKFENMRLSKYGFGYEFDIEIGLEMNFEEQHTLTERKTGKKITDFTRTRREPFKFSLFPAPDLKAVERYPFRKAELQANYKTRAMENVALMEDVYSGNVKFIVGQCIGLIEKPTKDNITLTCNYSGEKWLPFVGGYETLAQLPKTEIEIRLNIKAKK